MCQGTPAFFASSAPARIISSEAPWSECGAGQTDTARALANSRCSSEKRRRASATDSRYILGAPSQS